MDYPGDCLPGENTTNTERKGQSALRNWLLPALLSPVSTGVNTLSSPLNYLFLIKRGRESFRFAAPKSRYLKAPSLNHGSI